MNAITLKNVTRTFGKITAVDSLSLQVKKGEIFGLLGPNGAGKTTTINLMTGILRRQKGEVEIYGDDPARNPQIVRKKIGLVPQETNLYMDLSAVDNLSHHAALYCDNLDNLEENIREKLELMELYQRRNEPVRNYSGGMKRRLALARALLHEPEIIFFDEPTLGVDVQVRHALWDHIKKQKDNGKTFIISTNNMNEADALCDRLVIIDHGKAIALDNPENLKAALGRDIVTLRTNPPVEDPQVVFEQLDIHAASKLEAGVVRFEITKAEEKMNEIMKILVQNYTLEAISFTRPTLDDVFLHHTGRALRE